MAKKDKKEKADKTLKRIMLIVSYNGKNYCGWQRQPNMITVGWQNLKDLLRLQARMLKL